MAPPPPPPKPPSRTTGSEARQRLSMLIDMFGVSGTLLVPTADPRLNASPAIPDEAELFQRIFGEPPPQ